MQVVMMTMDELQEFSSNLVNSTIVSLPRVENTSTVPEFMSRLQACSYLGGISMPTLDKLVKEGKIVPVKPSPDRIVFYKEDLKSYLLSTKKAA